MTATSSMPRRRQGGLSDWADCAGPTANCSVARGPEVSLRLAVLACFVRQAFCVHVNNKTSAAALKNLITKILPESICRLNEHSATSLSDHRRALVPMPRLSGPDLFFCDVVHTKLIPVVSKSLT